MAGQLIKLISRMDITEGTTAFIFERPDNFEFKAGQSADFTLVHPAETDAEGNTRAFSIASPPYEQELMIATRMRNTAFKRILKSAQIGAEISVDGPFGSMTLHNNAARPAVFLTGGIGITPFRSMILRATKERLAHKLYLFYANRNPESAAFLEELSALQRQNSNFQLVATMDESGTSHRAWKGETGYINKNLLTKYLEKLDGPIYYIAGPPPMVSAMQKMLNEAGVNDDDIRSEAFSGY